MKIETKFFGPKEVDPKEFINFNHGLPGFENTHQYIILEYGEDSPFLVMQSIETPGLAFLIIGLDQLVPDYSIEINDEVVAELRIKQPEDVIIYAIINVPGELSKATVNLAAPVVINGQTKLGKQIILNNPAYSLKHPLIAPNPSEASVKAVVK
jgi:flagellar assembly factor FliW